MVARPRGLDACVALIEVSATQPRVLFGRRLAVVVPAFHEAPRVGEVLRTLPPEVDVVVVVDDASLDDTALVARDAAASLAGLRTTRVQVVRHATNRGVGAAIVTGYREAVASGAEVLAVMAGDGQMDPSELAHVAGPVARGEADYAKGTRLTRAWLGRMPVHRALGSYALGRLTELAIGVGPITDGQCGYTALSSRAVAILEEVLALEGLAPPGRGLDALWPRYGYPNDLLAACARAGLRVREVPVSPVYRGEPSGMRARHLGTIGFLVGRAALRRVRSKRVAGPRT
jgi:glycosyltransferase involved in cell wall biosynthesis